VSRNTAFDTPVPRILVVDDMPDNLFLMNGLFEDRYKVVTAGSGKEALAIVMGKEPPDMVLLDIMMPDMDGYEVMRRIRQHVPTANMPIIFLTALAGAQDERLGMELGAIDYLSKPVDPELVLQRVEAHVRATGHARRVEALAEKLSRHLAPVSWQRLFHGDGAGTIRFEEHQLSILYAEAPGADLEDERNRDSLAAELEWLATRHNGLVDLFEDAAGVVFFSDPGACVRMAMDLQRSARDLHLRMGVHTGICDIGTFRSDAEWRCTLLGHETRLAAKVAATAAIGSISISPETYALVKDVIHTDTAGCLLMEEFHDSDLAQVSLTPAPVKGSEHGLSTFAGLGRT
jgi:CheY-like chemotaxis protein